MRYERITILVPVRDVSAPPSDWDFTERLGLGDDLPVVVESSEPADLTQALAASLDQFDVTDHGFALLAQAAWRHGEHAEGLLEIIGRLDEEIGSAHGDGWAGRIGTLILSQAPDGTRYATIFPTEREARMTFRDRFAWRAAS